MDVYDSLDVGRQGDLAHKRVEGLPLLAKKIAPAYGEFTAFAHDEQHWHANAFSSRIIHWFLHLHLGFPLTLQSLVRRPPASFHSQRCSRATHPPAVRQLGRWGAQEATIRRRRSSSLFRVHTASSPFPTLMPAFVIPRLLALMNNSCIDCGRSKRQAAGLHTAAGRTSQEPHVCPSRLTMRYFSMRSISE